LAGRRGPTTGLTNLRFGGRARRRARAGRVVTWGALVSTAAMLVGVPGSDAGYRVVERLGERARLLPARDGVQATESAASVMHFRTRVFEARPSPGPSPTPDSSTRVDEAGSAPDAGESSVTEVVYEGAAEFGVDGDYLLSVASCESGLDPYAENPAGYYGLFQFDESTWAAYGYGSIFDARAQARTAAQLLAAGQASRWPNCA
jgi:hypothetical protein